MTLSDLVMQARTITRVAFDTLRAKSKRRGANLTNKVNPSASAKGPPSGVCGFPGFIKAHCHPFAFFNATLIGF